MGRLTSNECTQRQHFGHLETSVKCLENGRFYADRPPHTIWTSSECAKYYLCLEGEVFDFRCSTGLLFDVNRQICDFKVNVDNCDVTYEIASPKPLLRNAHCPHSGHLGCGDGTCLPQAYFCDGSIDCPDGSDEGHCNVTLDPNSATQCELQKCQLPHCFCTRDGRQIPGNGLDSEQIPQMILLTFDDAVNADNWDLYQELLLNEKHRNPNACPIAATFFISHQYNNYHQSQLLWNRGHEIAIHSITHRGPEQWWAANATLEDYFDEMVGQANILHRFSNVRLGDMRGMRVPFLRPGGDRHFLMMSEFGFEYDSSIVAPPSNPPIWPYTLDFRVPHLCTKQNCPNRPHKGIWELPINPLLIGGAENMMSCATLDSCQVNWNETELFEVLIDNFERHYMTNRAPFGLHLHADWLKKGDNFRAISRFLSFVLGMENVWAVTNTQALTWMKSPRGNKDLDNFGAWGCAKVFDRSEIACSVPNICKLFSRVFQEQRFVYTCAQCPHRYPWLRNEFGADL